MSSNDKACFCTVHEPSSAAVIESMQNENRARTGGVRSVNATSVLCLPTPQGTRLWSLQTLILNRPQWSFCPLSLPLIDPKFKSRSNNYEAMRTLGITFWSLNISADKTLSLHIVSILSFITTKCTFWHFIRGSLDTDLIRM